MIIARKIGTLVIVLALVAGCRPPIDGGPGPSASSIAGDLRPSKEMTVRFHLPLVPDVLAGPIVNAIARDVVGSAGVRLEIVTPLTAADAFQVESEFGIVNIFFATPAAAAVGSAAGSELVMVAGLQQTAGLLLAAKNGKSVDIESLGSGPILVQGRPGDEAPLIQAFEDVGGRIGEVEFIFQEPSVPLDPTGLYDGTFSALLLNSYDGAARIQEYIDPESGSSVGSEASTILAGINGDSLSRAGGLGLWMLSPELKDEDNLAAAALALIALGDGIASCRDDATACAALLNDSGLLDRYGDGLLWSINELNRTIWPANDGGSLGALSIDEASVRSSIAQAVAAGVISAGSVGENIFDRSVLDLMSLHLPPGLDLNGSDWLPIEAQLTLE